MKIVKVHFNFTSQINNTADDLNHENEVRQILSHKVVPSQEEKIVK